MEPGKLGTLQYNALCRLFGRKDFTVADVAQLDYMQVERLPKIGRKGINAIRAWLESHGHDLRNTPQPHGDVANARLSIRLEHAERLLLRHGYRVAPPAQHQD